MGRGAQFGVAQTGGWVKIELSYPQRRWCGVVLLAMTNNDRCRTARVKGAVSVAPARCVPSRRWPAVVRSGQASTDATYVELRRTSTEPGSMGSHVDQRSRVGLTARRARRAAQERPEVVPMQVSATGSAQCVALEAPSLPHMQKRQKTSQMPAAPLRPLSPVVHLSGSHRTGQRNRWYNSKAVLLTVSHNRD